MRKEQTPKYAFAEGHGIRGKACYENVAARWDGGFRIEVFCTECQRTLAFLFGDNGTYKRGLEFTLTKLKALEGLE